MRVSRAQRHNDNHKNKTSRWPKPLISIALSLSILSLGYYALRVSLEFPTVGLDFLNIWSTARIVLIGKVMALYDLAHLHALQESLFDKSFLVSYLQNILKKTPHVQTLIPYVWSYPPHMLPWIAGFGLLSYPVAMAAWIVGTFALYAFSIAYKRPQSWWLALILLAAPASSENIDICYVGFLIGAIFVGGLRLLDTKPILAGILFGFLTFKPQFAVLVPIALLAGGHWRAILSSVATTCVLIGLSIALFGLDPWLGFFHVMLPYQKTILEAAIGSTEIKTSLMVTPFMAAHIAGASLFLAYAVMGIFLAGAVGAVVYAFARPVSPDLRNAALLTAAFLATPYAFVTDMTTISAAIIFMLAARKRQPITLLPTIIMGAAWLLPVFISLFNFFKAPVIPFVFVGLLMVQLSWIAQARKHQCRAAPLSV